MSLNRSCIFKETSDSTITQLTRRADRQNGDQNALLVRMTGAQAEYSEAVRQFDS